MLIDWFGATFEFVILDHIDFSLEYRHYFDPNDRLPSVTTSESHDTFSWHRNTALLSDIIELSSCCTFCNHCDPVGDNPINNRRMRGGS